ncbi:uncharacterized protein [Dermacentor albipictus]|uniref:uncharacterized protein n=1 Tax=Dermacentor albipictus TaxID=60249 RepID=UPI0038FD23BE
MAPPPSPKTHRVRRHVPLPRLPAEDYKIVFRPGGGLDLRTTTNGALLASLCSSASVEYGNARVEDRVRINPYNNSFTVSTPSEQRTRQYVRTSELHLATQLYPLRAYVAAPDNALRGIIYNAVDNQNQEEIIEDLQAMNPSSTYAIADARQMGRTRSILITFVGTKELPRTVVFNCGLFICHPFRPKAEACFNCWSHGHRSDVCTKSRSGRCPRCGAVHAARDPPDCTPKCILCSGTHVTGSRPCKLRFERGGPSPLASSPKSTPSNSAQSTPSARDNRSSRPRQRSSSRSSQDRSPRHRSVSFPPLPGQDNPSASSQRLVQVVDWDRFRQSRQQASTSISDLSQWTTNLLQDVSSATSTVPTPPHSYTADSRLLHLWEAYHSLHRRWLSQKHNRSLRLRLARLAMDMEEHCSSLTRQQWGQTCERMAGSLGLRDTWALLRVLLDPSHSKATHRRDVTRLLHSSPLSDSDFLLALRDRYLCTNPPSSLPSYAGNPNSALDADITLGEVRAALHKLRTTSTPGADQISNKALRNLDTPSLEAITDLFNKHWHESTLPSEWTHAKVTFIPKPGKPIDIQNLRPISLTSCLGKLLEHVVLDRLQNFLEDNHLYPDSMFGFRPSLSTHDVMLQLSEEVLHPLHAKRTRAVLALDMTKAFDNVLHSAILDALSTLNVGPRIHGYITAFLARRTAEISFGPLTSPNFTLGNQGTPPGFRPLPPSL